MEMTKTEKGAVLRLSRSECADAGLSFESFGKNDAATERFLAAALTMLRERGFISSTSDTLDINVAEDGDGLTVSLSFRSSRPNVCVVRFDLPEELEAALHEIPQDRTDRCSLWSCGEGYALIAEGKSLRRSQDDLITAAKIREHGKLLSCSPFELI